MTDIVIPTLGRPSLSRLMASLARARGPLPQRIIIVDDRRDARAALDLGAPTTLSERITIVRAGGRGPAAARNAGWSQSTADWVAFLDDDVIVSPSWLDDLAADLAACGLDVAASQGRVDVPLPTHRKPTDWERNVAGLAHARWITADCAYRRADLLAVAGFDERFPRAYREDADLALRVTARGRRIAWGSRRVEHPVRPAAATVSIGLQAGNADDVLMEAVHGRDWYERAGAPRGVFGQHVWTVGAAAIALLAGATWLGATLRFAWRRIAPGPRTPREVAAMLITSAVLPFAAVAYRAAGWLALPRLLRDGTRRSTPPVRRAVLFDRDGTLVEDVPSNARPDAVRPMPGAREAVHRLRAAGFSIGIVTNQSGIGLGTVSAAAVDAVNARIVELVGPIDTIAICPHAPAAGCRCRKPAPGLIADAARALGVAPRDCIVVGDIGSDVEAARAAGAAAILVPTPITLPQEVAAAGAVATDLTAAVDAILGRSA
jgi:histidinol-phosphate phosphatase family protein